MTIRKIAQLGEPVLRRRAEEVTRDELLTPDTQALIDDMIETMRDAEGAGIAAPQVYRSKRIVVVEVSENSRYPDFPGIPLVVLVNPRVEPLVEPIAGSYRDSDSIRMYEGCLSVAGIRGLVRRARRIACKAWDRTGQRFEAVYEGMPAAVLQHEADHLEGVLFVDRADPRSLCFVREFERHVPKEQRVVDGLGPDV